MSAQKTGADLADPNSLDNSSFERLQWHCRFYAKEKWMRGIDIIEAAELIALSKVKTNITHLCPIKRDRYTEVPMSIKNCWFNEALNWEVLKDVIIDEE